MSPLELHNEKLNTMSDKMDETSMLVKKAIRLWPALLFVGGIVGGIVGFTWGVFQFNLTLVKHTEYDKHLAIENSNAKTVSRSLIIDSTVNKVQDQRLDKLESAKSTRVTATSYGKDVEFHRVN